MNLIIASTALNTLGGLIASIIFAVVAMGLLIVTYKGFDKFTPGDLHGEIFKGNTAAAILAAGVLVATAIILNGAIS